MITTINEFRKINENNSVIILDFCDIAYEDVNDTSYYNGIAHVQNKQFNVNISDRDSEYTGLPLPLEGFEYLLTLLGLEDDDWDDIFGMSDFPEGEIAGNKYKITKINNEIEVIKLSNKIQNNESVVNEESHENVGEQSWDYFLCDDHGCSTEWNIPIKLNKGTAFTHSFGHYKVTSYEDDRIIMCDKI